MEDLPRYFVLFFFFQAEDGIRDYKVTGVQTCALPISSVTLGDMVPALSAVVVAAVAVNAATVRPSSKGEKGFDGLQSQQDKPDRKSTRLNSSHLVISYAVFCLKKKKTNTTCSVFSHCS